MKIEGHPISRKDVERVNRAIDSIWASPNTKTVQLAEFVENTYGSDCIEITVAGDSWFIHDMTDDSNMIRKGEGWLDVSSKELFALCAELSPEERITWHKNPDDIWHKI